MKRAVLLAIVAGLALVGVGMIADAAPLGDDQVQIVQETSHCAEDQTADGIVDMFDIVVFANWFGHATINNGGDAPWELDLEPFDGYVDVTGDISKVANHFTEKCAGAVEQEATALGIEGITPMYGVANCVFHTYGWITGNTPNVAVSTNWGGVSKCESTVPEANFRTECHFMFEKYVPGGGWFTVAVSSVVDQPGLECSGKSYNPAELPFYVRLHGSFFHRIWNTQWQILHGGHNHAEDASFCMTELCPPPPPTPAP